MKPKTGGKKRTHCDTCVTDEVCMEDESIRKTVYITCKAGVGGKELKVTNVTGRRMTIDMKRLNRTKDQQWTEQSISNPSLIPSHQPGQPTA